MSERTCCGSYRSLAGACSFKHVAAIICSVLHRAGEVGMPRPRAMHWRCGFEVVQAAVAVGNHERHRTAGRVSEPDTAEHLHVIVFNALATAAAVPALTTPQFGVDERCVNVQASRKPGHNRNAPGPVRFASSLKRQSWHAGECMEVGRSRLPRGEAAL